MKKYAVALFMSVILSACGFHPQGKMQLAAPLHKIYISSIHPYGYLTRYLESYLKSSSVQITSSTDDADTILSILKDDTSQELTGQSGTQQTRQYNIHVTVVFSVTDKTGRLLTEPQSLTESRAITIQANQVLGSSNEANLYYQQMRRTLAYAIMNRLSSHAVTKDINDAYKTDVKTKKSST